MAIAEQNSPSPESTSSLLRRFVGQGSELAFAALVRRYGGLVYASALRRTGDASLAEDVAQDVFTALARRAPALAADDRLGAWLHLRAVRTAADRMKAEQRRRRREAVAAPLLQETGEAMQSAWQELAPVLDEALASLREGDRTALVLRYLEGRSLREVGQALGIGDDAAQKRVSRAAEKLRHVLSRRGCGLATGALVLALGQGASAAAPGGMAARICPQAFKQASGGWAGFWRVFPLAAPAGAGALVVCLASGAVSFSKPEPRRLPVVALPAAAGSATSGIPASPVEPGLTLEETVRRLKKSVEEHGWTAAPALVTAQREALAATVPGGRALEALGLYFGGQKPGSLPPFLESWMTAAAHEDPVALLRLCAGAGAVCLSEASRRVGLELVKHPLPPQERAALARTILGDTQLPDSVKEAAAAFFSRDPGTGQPDDPETLHSHVAEAVDAFVEGKGEVWLEAAVQSLGSVRGCRTLIDAMTDHPDAKAKSARFQAISIWGGLDFQGMAAWIEQQPAAWRQGCANNVLSGLPQEAKDAAELAQSLARAEWAMRQEPDPVEAMRCFTRPRANFSEWASWLESHPELIRQAPEKFLELLQAHVTLVPHMEHDREICKTPILDRLRPFFQAWRRVDPAAVAKRLAEDHESSSDRGLQRLLQTLAAETP